MAVRCRVVSRGLVLGSRLPMSGKAASRCIGSTFFSHANRLPATTISGSHRLARIAGRRHSSSSNNNKPKQSVSTTFREHSPGNKTATLTVSNPAKLNIVNTSLLNQLIDACKALSTDTSLRAVIFTGGQVAPGKEPSFIGGADITEMHQLSSSDEARNFIERIHLACKAIRDLPVPVIARVHGFCLGAGLEIAAACDLRVATTMSVFGMPEVKVGIPSVVEAALLAGLIGMGRTRRLLYLAENIDAATAER